MKSLSIITTFIFSALLIGLALSVQAQSSRDMQYFRAQDKSGINIFETPKTTDVEFDGLKIRFGGSNTLQFQQIYHTNAPDAPPLFDIGPNFNLATSNLDLDVQLDRGVRMHLRTYLSSRHHPEPYVKGGYMQVDRLDFISPGFMDEIMDYVTIKVGHMQNNYGDNHFRRSDNAQAFFNPFVGNYIMDSFTTEVGAEVYFQKNGLLFMLGGTNGKLNQSVVKAAPGGVNTKPSILAKLGYDKQLNDDLRVRLTGSVYHTGQSARTYIYAGDRAGSRYYNVITSNSNEFRTPRFDPGFVNELTAIMVNPFVKFKGLEFYGVLETASGKTTAETDTRSVLHLAGELIYRFGKSEDFYFGGRYNTVSGKIAGGTDISINRINVGGGWFLNNNILAKVEFVNQEYTDFPAGSIFDGAKMNGLVIEAVISF